MTTTSPTDTEHTAAFILGAGASKPLAPLQTELIADLWKKSSKPYPPDFPINRLWPAKAYLRRTFPGLPENSPSFEDVVGPLEISEAEEYWYHYAGWDRDGRLVTNRKVLDALDTWLAYALDPMELPRDPADASFQAHYAPSPIAVCPYARLIGVLRDLAVLRNTAFLSLNYDILLDRCLIASGDLPEYYVEAFFDDPSTPKGLVGVFKLHGSLNWGVCGECHVLKNLGLISIWPGSTCKVCGESRARPMLIRPTLLKDFRHRVWKDVWKTAGRDLARYRHWVFIGYSLPLADVWMLRLLTQSIRSKGVKNRRISVVDPNPEVLDRYRLMFPQARLVAGSFGDYAEECRKTGEVL